MFCDALTMYYKIKSLPAYFEPWNELASSLPDLIREKKLRDAVAELPLLDHNQLREYSEWRLAHLQLSLITAGYVWQNGDKGVTQVLPKSLAYPFFNISSQLGLQPVLSHADLALANWSIIDQNGPYDFENLECLYHLPGGKAADWFCMVTFMVELSFAKCMQSIVRILELLGSAGNLSAGVARHEEQTETEVSQCLQQVSTAMNTMQDSLARMRDNLEANVFFNVIRPFLSGWGGDTNPLPEGLIYEGISDTPVKLTGGSAAQSTTLQVLDALLGIKHIQDKREFLVRMREFMPPEHKHLIEYIEQLPYTLRDFVTSSSNQVVKAAYNHAISTLTELRDYHIQIVKMYVVLPAKKANEGNYESLDNKGTGGTSLIPFLKDIWADTRERLLADNQTSLNASDGHSSVAGLTVLAALAAAAVILGFSAVSALRR
ncbi:unnamed protein product [Candidula unifasciata]|uniref:Indoleamine 2,3-dioxygenase n=1 Tax=Candidula unifasciata TaxID=100452 RepID=A0A8S3YIG8_9EUPU|nr:unnamed protein product [Candidula unifasciata]